MEQSIKRANTVSEYLFEQEDTLTIYEYELIENELDLMDNYWDVANIFLKVSTIYQAKILDIQHLTKEGVANPFVNLISGGMFTFGKEKVY